MIEKMERFVVDNFPHSTPVNIRCGAKGEYARYSVALANCEELAGVLRELAFRMPPPRTKNQQLALDNANAAVAQWDEVKG